MQKNQEYNELSKIKNEVRIPKEKFNREIQNRKSQIEKFTLLNKNDPETKVSKFQ